MKFCPECSERLSDVDALRCDHCQADFGETVEPGSFLRLRGLAMAVMVAITAAVAARGVSAWQTVRDLSIRRDPGGTQRALFTVALLLFLLAAVLFVAWLWRARRNVDTYPEAARLRFSPAWAIGGWFVPYANVFIPDRVMQDVAMVSTRTRRAVLLVRVGWGAFLMQPIVLLLGPVEAPTICGRLTVWGSGPVYGGFRPHRQQSSGWRASRR